MRIVRFIGIVLLLFNLITLTDCLLKGEWGWVVFAGFACASLVWMLIDIQRRIGRGVS